MKLAVCYHFGKPLVVEDVVLDPPRKGSTAAALRNIIVF
jgi:tRNA/tmRNA/rRNA uracil-C5-methylase (TrmA/RlmC/RlmD family)